MGIESAQRDRTCQQLFARGIWLAVWLTLICTLPGRMILGQESELKQDAPLGGPFVAQVSEMESGGAASIESSETIEPLEPLEHADAQSLRNRLISYVFFGCLTLVFLGLLFGYLRLDHATRGFQSGRLQLAALVLSGIVLVVSYLLWTQVLFK